MARHLHESEERAIKELLERYNDWPTSELKKKMKELRRRASLREITKGPEQNDDH